MTSPSFSPGDSDVLTHSDLVTGTGEPVQLGALLGRGGEGRVYASGRPDEAVKLYLTPPDDLLARKLQALAVLGTPDLRRVSAWPTATVHRQGPEEHTPLVGLMMPVLPPGARPMHDLTGPRSRRQFFPQADLTFLLTVARELADAAATVHAAGHTIGDFNANNVQVAPEGQVMLIDVDSFDVRQGSLRFPCGVGVPEYTAPELQGRGFSGVHRHPGQDDFALAVFVFQLLFGGRHPYAGVWDFAPPGLGEAIEQHAFAYSLRRTRLNLSPPPLSGGLEHLLPETAELFEQAFGTVPLRPSAEVWARHLTELPRHLAACRAGHLHFSGRPCASCDVLAEAKSRRGRWDTELAALRDLEIVAQGLLGWHLHYPVYPGDPRLLGHDAGMTLRTQVLGSLATVGLAGLGYLIVHLPLPGSLNSLLIATVIPTLGFRVYRAGQTANHTRETRAAAVYLALLDQAAVWEEELIALARRYREMTDTLNTLIPPEGPARHRAPGLPERARAGQVIALRPVLDLQAQRLEATLTRLQNDLDLAAQAL